MNTLALQVLVAACFVGIIVVLFFEKTDYLTYAIALTGLAAVTTSLCLPEVATKEAFVLSIKWEVIFFLVFLFAIVEVLDEEKVFQEVARRITSGTRGRPRQFFYLICTISTLSAALIEDISVAIIFVPLIVKTCERSRIDPTPYLLGMTVCINLASTLTPFGSAENVLIATEFGLGVRWFITNIGLFFVTATALTLVLLDQLVLKKSIGRVWDPSCPSPDEGGKDGGGGDARGGNEVDVEVKVLEDPIPRGNFYRNLSALGVFVVLLFFIPNILLAGFVGLLLFVFLNPKDVGDGKTRPRVSYYLKKVDYKIVFFFMCLFVLVFCMEANGTIALLEGAVAANAPEDTFMLAIVILLATSVLSGLLDNLPVTVVFIPIIRALVVDLGLTTAQSVPLLVAFILGINVGGNFLPQGAACDMMTLELSKKFCVTNMTFRKLLKVGGGFALFHIVIGIAYLAVLVRFI
ncbi:MAG: SLC13 family permease [Promethearchaeota archaeon]